MSTPASVRNHPIHPMLVAIPIGLWVFGLVADLIYHAGWGGPLWKEIARYCVGGGIVGALLAALPGLVDLTSISDRRVRTIALTHMTVNVIAVALFAVSLWMRANDPLGGWPVAVAGLGLVGVGLGGWLGGELVYVHGMGVKPATTSAGRPPGRERAGTR